MHKVEEGAAGVGRTIETGAAKVKANHMVSVLVTLYDIHEQQSQPLPSHFQAATFG